MLMNFIETLVFDNWYKDKVDLSKTPNFRIARVISVNKTRYRWRFEIMTRVTGATVKLDDGTQVAADAFGNNIAILCPNCKKQPTLLIALRHQKGSDIEHLAACTACGKRYYIASNLNVNVLQEVIIKEI
jgi:uncharacterized protein YbaR (Trm112 family)